MNKTVLLRNPSVVGTTFSRLTGQVCFTADFKVGEDSFRQVPFLRLLVESYGDDEEDRDMFSVYDEYCHIIPYLKPIADFRLCFSQKLMPMAMRATSVDASGLLKRGLQRYAKDLRTFSDDVSIIRQAKSSVNILNPNRDDSLEKARAILKVLGKMPSTETPFSME